MSRTTVLLLTVGLAFGAGAAWEQVTRRTAGPAGVAAAPGTAVPDREAVFEATFAKGRALLVYGGADPDLAARYRAALEAYVRNPRGMLRRIDLSFHTDAEVTPDSLTAGFALLFGTPASNAAIRDLGAALPVTFRDGAFELFGRRYADPGDVVSVSLRNPSDPHLLMVVLTGNSDAAILDHLGSGGRGIWYSDYVVWRSGEVIRDGEYGEAADGAWIHDPARDQDRLGWAEEYRKNLVTVERPRIKLELPKELAARADAEVLADAIDARVGRMAAALGLASVTPPLVVHYHPDTEWKGKLTGEVVDEHADDAGANAYRMFRADRPEGDGIAEAEALLHRVVGKTRCAWLDAGSILWLAQSWLGVPLEEWPGRLADMGVWTEPADFIRGEFEHHSYFFVWPAAGAYVTRLVDLHGVDAWRALWAKSLADPDLAGYEPEPMPEPPPRSGGIPAGRRLPASDAAAFDRGVCYAHDYSLDFGYGSRKSRMNLQYLRDKDFVNAVSISPFGYISGAGDPEIGHRDRMRGRGGSSSENDESLIAETAQAHALGIKVMLAPHLWGRVWCGEWGAASEADWPEFFAEYRAFILHYAALAEYAGCDLLMVGKELSATAARSAEWRALIADVRRVYHGPVTYGANWNAEYTVIDWWDAVDYIGVSQYTPLSQSESPSAAELAAGVSAVAGRLDSLAARYDRPYLLTEVGFTAGADAARTPWESYDRDGGADLELQARCYEAVLSVFAKRPACAGMYWWKWFTDLSSNNSGRNRYDYPPYGKPAEGVMRAWYGRIKDAAAPGGARP